MVGLGVGEGGGVLEDLSFFCVEGCGSLKGYNAYCARECHHHYLLCPCADTFSFLFLFFVVVCFLFFLLA